MNLHTITKLSRDVRHPILLYKILPWWSSFSNMRFALHLFDEVVCLDQYHAKDYIKKGSVVIDAGANMGVFSIFAASLGGSVYAFEPGEEPFAVLKEKAKRFDIHPVQRALGEKEGTSNLHIMKHNFASFLDGSGMMHEEKAGLQEVRVTTIDAFVLENKIPRVDFIKIDTEGYEGQILQGAAKTIARDKPVVAMSAYHHPDDKEQLPKLLKSICPEYICELHKDYEEDFICHV